MTRCRGAACRLRRTSVPLPKSRAKALRRLKPAPRVVALRILALIRLAGTDRDQLVAQARLQFLPDFAVVSGDVEHVDRLVSLGVDEYHFDAAPRAGKRVREFVQQSGPV